MSALISVEKHTSHSTTQDKFKTKKEAQKIKQNEKQN